jgi:hypothetical protein
MSVHPIPATRTPVQSASNPETPTSLLHLLAHTLADQERTTNAKDLLITGSKAISRIILSVGIVLVVTITLAAIMIYFVGLGPAIGGGIAVGGTATTWAARSLWTRHNANKVTTQIPASEHQ